MVTSKLVLVGIGVVLALGGQVVPAHARAQGPTHNLVKTMYMDGTARSLDQSPIGSVPPPQWNQAGFDDSSWVPVRAVPSSVSSCVQKWIYAVYRPLYTGKIYWGDSLMDHYLFRQTCGLPKAHDYYGSEVGVVGQFVAARYALYVNGAHINGSSFYQGIRYNIEKDLHAGQNVIAIDANAGPATSCTGLLFRAVIHAAGIK